MRTLGVIAIILMVSCAAAAQWVNLTLPNIPRTPDGKPNLAAPAPKAPDGKPDLSGIWRVASGKYLQNIAADLGEPPFQPWAAALYKERVAVLGKGRPSEGCIPHGIPDGMVVRNFPFKIVQTPGVVVILYEEFNHFRQIFTDGRGFPPETSESWFGYSVGKWEGNTLVAETVGFNDKSWLDDPGHPHSEALRVTERFQRRDFGHMDIQITFDDPKAYTKPWTVTIPFDLYADTELMESICENEKDRPNMVGK
ncbi:MAG: hypothetical protein DMG11_11020 [Acidobacteria bacterium]|nr:MAG: hypothetical protein DMG11_11020 [Acidobacteriota bacterium]